MAWIQGGYDELDGSHFWPGNSSTDRNSIAASIAARMNLRIDLFYLPALLSFHLNILEDEK